MSESKGDGPGGTGSKRAGTSSDRQTDRSTTSEQGNGGDGPVTVRKQRYLVAVRTGGNALVPMATEMLTNSLSSSLSNIEGVRILKRMKPRGFSALSAGPSLGGVGATTPEIICCEMDPERGEALRAQARTTPHYIVEVDAQLKHLGLDTPNLIAASLESTLLPSKSGSVDVRVRVLGEDGRPLPKAEVYVYGAALPSQGLTDASGNVTLTVFGGPVTSVRAIYIKPEANHWERFISRPALDADGVNTVQLQPLTTSFPKFPDVGIVGWGHRLMRLDQVAAGLTGRGVKVGIIDSGCDNTHPQLRHVQNGVDCTNNNDAGSWVNDQVSHGTHCAGVIGAASSNVQGIRGFVPDAEIHAFKVFPSGRFSDLIDALDQCIERGIDVVNLSLGSDQVSELVAQKLLEARQKGIACIVAAGNSGGPVQFPGTLPSVLTVSAIGKTGEFPPDTYHAQNVPEGFVGAEGVFPAKFSCFGPEVAVCAPGVAIVSSVPGGGYAAWDGTSMATPHVTGLAALMLAHHPAFASKQRSEARVALLFQLIRASAVPYIADVTRGGSGLPVAQLAPATPVAGVAAHPPTMVQAPVAGGVAGLPVGGTFGNAWLPYSQVPVAMQNPALLQNALAASYFANPAALQMLVQMRAAGLI
jgi:subtilisin